MANVNSGKANREAVQGLINDMRMFNEVVAKEIDQIELRTDRLGEMWRDAQYAQFSAFMSALTESLSKDLGVLDEAADALQSKLNLY